VRVAVGEAGAGVPVAVGPGVLFRRGVRVGEGGAGALVAVGEAGTGVLVAATGVLVRVGVGGTGVGGTGVGLPGDEADGRGRGPPA
jgi:hypothetical protein